MLNFNYQEEYPKLLTQEIVGCLCALHEYKGRQDFILKGNEANLGKMYDQARLLSIESSNRMVGITAGESQLKKLAADKATPHKEKEKKITGYRDAWMKIYREDNPLMFSPDAISELHKDLYRWQWISGIGAFRKSNHLGSSESSGMVPCQQIFPSEDIPDAMDQLCSVFGKTACTGPETLMFIPMAVLDFLRIQPFSDGNERMSRLLIHLLLVQNGFYVGRYSSIEERIEERSESYYQAIASSASDPYKGSIDYAPFALYLLRIISDACQEFTERISIMGNSELSKPDQVRETVRKYKGEFTKAEIARRCPNISEKTMQRAFEMLIKTKMIIKISGGWNTTYKWNGEMN